MPRHLPVITENPRPSTPGEALYVAPTSRREGRFCGNCVLWAAPVERCIIHDRLLPVKREMVCGYHLFGKPLPTWVDLPGLAVVSPETSGLIIAPAGGTKCSNCAWFDSADSYCHRVAGEIRSTGWVPAAVDAAGCCAQWSP